MRGNWRMMSDWPRCPVTKLPPFTSEIRKVMPDFDPEDPGSRERACIRLRSLGQQVVFKRGSLDLGRGSHN